MMWCPVAECKRGGVLLVLGIAIWTSASFAGVVGWDVVDKCTEQCYSSSVVEPNNEFNIRCNDSCEIDQCLQGCELWTEALSDSCQELCNGTTENIPTQALYCMMGCHSALSIYVSQIKAELGVPRAPVLVAGSQTNVSVTLAWKGSSLPNVSYLLQCKFEALPGDWEYYQPQKPLKRPEAKITGLQPYTKYKFRVAWLILPQWDPLLSEESVAISTLPYGVPSSAPTISLSAIDPTRILVSWDPPLFPNGPILSYAVSLKEMKSNHILVKDVSNQNAERFYLFSNLLPATAYSLSVLARNYMGEGPAKSATITTPTRGHIQKNDGSPYLVLGARQNVIKQGDMFDESVVVYQSPNSSTMVTGVSLHYHRQVMYVSDSLGFVHSVPLESQDDDHHIIIQPSSDSHSPGLLSVDWLNDLIYMVDRNKIVRCDLDGRNYETVLVGLQSSPTDMKVDPYNGFLYWVLRSQTKGGLYKVDLADLGSGPLTLPESKLIFTDDHLMAFAADFSSLQLLLPMETKNTVVAVSLDGLEITDIRQNTQQPQFRGVRSFVVHHGLLFWTTGDELIGEEYQLSENKYYHNSYAGLTASKPFVGLNVLHPDAQPYPVPLNPASQVEAVFDQTKAKVCWSPPRLLRGLGLGAWQKWSYELHVSDHENRPIAHSTNISLNWYTVHNLRENTTYYIKVRAYSSGGKGPWSEEFRGKTLRKGVRDGYPFLLWSSKDGILKSNMVISVVEPFIHQQAFHRSHVIDFAWYDDMLFMNTNSSHIYVYNMTSRQQASRLESIGSAHSLAVDWFARKLYWSNPYQQVISRANFDGSQQEPLPLPTVARELNLDSPGGFLYWTTLYSVECARLHGTERQVYFQAGFFAGKQVLGLTVDHDHHLVYWLVRSQEGSQLFRATMAGHALTNVRATVEEVGLIHEDVVRGPVRYYSDRLFWLYNHREALITDMGGRNAATLHGPGLTNLKTLTMIDPRQHAFPGSFTAHKNGIRTFEQFLFADGFNKHTLNVRPDQVSLTSIIVEGTWQGFNVSWQPVTNVNYGKVFYEIKVDSDYDRNTQITESNDFVYPEAQLLPPHTRISIALRSFTYWSSSRRVIKILYSPMSVPSAPRHLRVFIVHEKPNLSISQPAVLAELRWSEPERSNGIILGYKVLCWREDKPNNLHLECNVTLIQPRKLVYHLRGLHPDSTYKFQVRAFTEVGSGPGSPMLEAKTSEETPVPRLLLAKSSAVEVADMDTHEEQLIAMDVTEPVDVAFLSQDDTVFWIDSKSGIMRSNINGENRTQVLPLESMGSSISVDWISRFLYWSDVGDQFHGSRIWKMGLNSYSTSPEMVLETQGSIKTLRVHPFSSMLIFTLGYPDHPGLLMSSKMDGSEPKMLLDSASRYFTQRRKRRETYEQCSCPREVDVGKALTLDMLDPTQPEVLWVDEVSGHIWAADITGCHCYVVLNASLTSNNGLPPTSITVDKTRVYWSNASLHSIYSLEKPLLPGMHMGPQENNPVNTEIVNGVHAITAIGRSLQPLPDAHCLVPVQYKAPPVLLGRTSSSLTLQFDPVDFPSDCQNISRPSTYYVIYYRLASENDTFNCSVDTEGCHVWKSHVPQTTITNLLPYRQYGVQAAVGSFYSTSHSLLTKEVFFMTSEGAPSSPRNVTIEVMSPESLLVTWLVPEHLNGLLVHYYLSWEMQVPITGQQRQGEQLVHTHSKPTSSLHALLSGLLPNQAYYVTVRAYSSRMENFSESARTLVVTFPRPGNLSLAEVMSSQLLLRWQVTQNQTFVDHGVYCKALSNEAVHATEQFAFNSSINLFSITGLQHKTKYHCHLQLIYCANPKYCNYTWPKDDRFTFETLGDVPSEPGIPSVTQLRADSYQISWLPADSNGGSQLHYILGARHSESDNNENLWRNVYNGTHWRWTVTGLDVDSEYVFRVKAVNEYGASNFTISPTSFRLKNSGDNDDDDTSVILVASVSVIGVLVIITLIVLYKVCKQRGKEKLMMMHDVMHCTAGGNLELATLQELPQHENFIHQNNILYTIGNHLLDAELVVLPHIGRDQIVLTKFLGSGAFGEVFEGFARDLNTEEDQDRKVAIKTLRKGATDQEKGEFLKEAQLMSNFKHEHILRLLAVCLDNDPNFLILELMEGGDLLSYLRSNRPSAFESTSLTVQDLISICVDVAKGCKYLEEMHFVHRDLAARNCLVSSTNPALRVVKIGDFGLARDIYKNDYYRKEGEGLLPVRWMSPESLVDGVFTTQSDVWAFGVLLWEVMTLGQQPYPARTNLEVLHYVRAGGRLDKPDNCPDDLHQLMLQCWNYSADDRPTFALCLDQLQELKRKSADMPHCVHNNNYVGRTPADGVHNPAYIEEDSLFEEEKIHVHDLKDKFLRDSNDDVASISSDPTARGTNRNRLGILASDSIQRSASWDVRQQRPGRILDDRSHGSELPKYLQLLRDEESMSSLTSDGYEIPIASTICNKPDCCNNQNNSTVKNRAETPDRHASAKPITDEKKALALSGQIDDCDVHLLSSEPCDCQPVSNNQVADSPSCHLLNPTDCDTPNPKKYADVKDTLWNQSNESIDKCGTCASETGANDLVSGWSATIPTGHSLQTSWC